MPSTAFLKSFTERRDDDRAALYWYGRSIGYRQLADTAGRMAAEIDRLVEGRAPVAVVAEKSPETIALIVGCWLTGRAVLVPAPTLGTSSLSELTARAGCSHVLKPAAEPGKVDVRATGHVAGEPVDTHGSLLMLTTSGSTGVPKIVPMAPEGVDRFFAWATTRFEIGPDATVLSFAPLNFDLSLLDVWSSLYAGARVALVDPVRAADGSYLADLLADAEVDVVQAVPVFYRLVRETAGRSRPFPARHVILTGDATPHQLLAELPALFPKARVHNVYGCTETNDSFVHEVESFDLAPSGRLPIGRPIDGVDAQLLDDEGKPVHGPGTGELVVRTPFQARGYLDSTLDAGRFVAGPGGTWYRTGDVVRRTEDGLYVLEGRNDFHVKVRGVRTNIQEVEHVLMLHPDIREAAVIPLPDPLGGYRLHAAVRRRAGSGLNSLGLRAHCARNLPKSAVPSTVGITDEELPRTSTGKVDRNAVKTALAKGE